LQCHPYCSWIVLSEQFLIVETGKSQEMKSPINMANTPKPSHCAWKSTFSPGVKHFWNQA
jgi:hypothetical protein